MLNSPRNMNLAYLNLYTYNDFAKGITADFSNIKALHTPINDYLRTIYLDDISAFLILYSILETLADTETVYFDEKDIMKQVFESLFESFIQGMRDANEEKNEKYSNGSPIFKAIEQKWNNFSNELIKKPKEMNPIKQIIKDNNIDWKKLNRHFSTVKKKGTGIKDIKDLRNTIVHDRKEDYTELLDMKNINSDLSFAVCIILLRKMGITNVDFDKNWDKLSIMKYYKLFSNSFLEHPVKNQAPCAYQILYLFYLCCTDMPQIKTPLFLFAHELLDFRFHFQQQSTFLLHIIFLIDVVCQIFCI